MSLVLTKFVVFQVMSLAVQPVLIYYYSLEGWVQGKIF
jgi:hypothetical protein